MKGGAVFGSVLKLAFASALLLSAEVTIGWAAALTEADAARRIEADYGVEVLRVRAGERNGSAVWLVTFMVPGGNSNAAFQVQTLALEQATGALVPSFRHRRSGYDLPPPGSGGAKSEARPDAARSRTWR